MTAPRPTATATPRSELRFERLGELGALPVVSRLHSAHPAGDFVAHVRVDAKAAQYGKKGRPPFPEGALIVEELSPGGEGPATLTYVMQRGAPGANPAANDWLFGVIGADGAVQAFGKLPLCARCHAEAGPEHVFERVAAASSQGSGT